MMRPRWLWIVLTVAVLGALAAGPVLAAGCDDMQGTTPAALVDCVQHALDSGVITNAGVGQSLLSQAQAAQAAAARGDTAAAVNTLQAVVALLNAQAGKTIDATHAGHMVMHAQMVIEALQQ